MYRGSSFLLQKDYKVHKDAVLEMQKEKYNILRSATPKQLISKDSLKTIEELNEFYLEWKSVIDDENQKINSNGIKYPTMKILDILFWQIGFDDDIEGSLKVSDEV